MKNKYLIRCRIQKLKHACRCIAHSAWWSGTSCLPQFRKSDFHYSLSAAGRQRLSSEARGRWKLVALWKVIPLTSYSHCTGLDNTRNRIIEWFIVSLLFQLLQFLLMCLSANFIRRLWSDALQIPQYFLHSDALLLVKHKHLNWSNYMIWHGGGSPLRKWQKWKEKKKKK